MIDPVQIEGWIRDGLPCEHVAVQGDGHHFEAVIVSSAFRGLSRVQQHQRVYAALGGRMAAEIHALSMQTYTPENWAAKGSRQNG
jgi:acid stress-induced BolA-like protein IbaG/YrbA